MSLPAIKEVRRLFPSARITYWASKATIPILEAAGIIDETCPVDRDLGSLMVRPFRMKAKLAAGNFDLVILFQNAFESALTSWLAGIPVRVGYPTDCRGPLLSVRIPLNKEVMLRHQVYYYLAITGFIETYLGGGGGQEQITPDCSIRISENEIHRAREILVSLGLDLNRAIFCLCPGSVNSNAKRWPEVYFARLATLFVDRLDAQVVFAGAPQESSLIDEIMSRMDHTGAVNLAGMVNLVSTMAVMKLSTMVISNDTGSAHLAVAASSHVLTIFGPTSAGATAPYGPDAHIIQGEAPCAPCRHFTCPKPNHPCMTSIKPEAVFKKVQDILTGLCP